MIDPQIDSLHAMLEIVIVACNRVVNFESTLSQLAASPFNRARLTILDNCSTDAIQNISRKYNSVFPFMTVVRQNYDIGLNASYLHAIENLSAKYGWIINDKVDLDFTLASQLIEALESDAYDLLFVGSRAKLSWDGTESCSMNDLVAADARIYTTLTFWPSLLFRAALFNEECIVKGYRLANNVYPNFPFINYFVERNAPAYVSAGQMVWADVDDLDCTGLFWYAAWLNYCQTIKNKDLSERSIGEVTRNYGFIKSLAFLIAFDKTRGTIIFWSRVVDIIWGLPFRQRLKFLLLFPLVFIPIPHVLLENMRQRYVSRWQQSGDIRPFSSDREGIRCM